MLGKLRVGSRSDPRASGCHRKDRQPLLLQQGPTDLHQRDGRGGNGLQERVCLGEKCGCQLAAGVSQERSQCRKGTCNRRQSQNHGGQGRGAAAAAASAAAAAPLQQQAAVQQATLQLLQQQQRVQMAQQQQQQQQQLAQAQVRAMFAIARAFDIVARAPFVVARAI